MMPSIILWLMKLYMFILFLILSFSSPGFASDKEALDILEVRINKAILSLEENGGSEYLSREDFFMNLGWGGIVSFDDIIDLSSKELGTQIEELKHVVSFFILQPKTDMRFISSITNKRLFNLSFDLIHAMETEYAAQKIRTSFKADKTTTCVSNLSKSKPVIGDTPETRNTPF